MASSKNWVYERYIGCVFRGRREQRAVYLCVVVVVVGALVFLSLRFFKNIHQKNFTVVMLISYMMMVVCQKIVNLFYYKC